MPQPARRCAWCGEWSRRWRTVLWYGPPCRVLVGCVECGLWMAWLSARKEAL